MYPEGMTWLRSELSQRTGAIDVQATRLRSSRLRLDPMVGSMGAGYTPSSPSSANPSTMPFPPLNVEMAHGVLGVPLDEPQSRTREAIDQLSAALRVDFGASGHQLPVQDNANPQAPYLVLQSKASVALFSPVQADFEARFFGTHSTDPETCREFVGDKMSTLLHAWSAGGAHPVLAGIVVTLHFVYDEDSEVRPVQHMLDHHFSGGMASDALDDAKIQLTLRVHDEFFVTLGIGSYKTQEINQAILPGVSSTVIRPWEPEVVEQGIELTVDVNNRLRAQVQRKHTRVDDTEIGRVNSLAWDVVKRIAMPLASGGVLDTATLEQAVA